MVNINELRVAKEAYNGYTQYALKFKHMNYIV